MYLYFFSSVMITMIMCLLPERCKDIYLAEQLITSQPNIQPVSLEILYLLSFLLGKNISVLNQWTVLLMWVCVYVFNLAVRSVFSVSSLIFPFTPGVL